MLLGCSCGGAEPAVRTTSPTEASEATEAADYEVHEWGLVRGGTGDVLNVGAVAPPARAYPMAVDKPVLYFHTAAPLSVRSVRVHAAGTILEHWPNAPRTGIAADVGWSRLTITPGADCELTPLPTDCGTWPAGEICEVPGLAAVRTAESPCIVTPEGTDTMLFYRSRADTVTPPLLFTRSPGSDVITVRNDGGEAIPGRLIRLHNSGFQVRALAVSPPGPGETLELGADFAAAGMDEDVDGDMPAMPGSPEPGRAALRASLLEVGLTAQEADAFIRVWDAQLFGGPAALDSRTVDRLSVDDEATMDGLPAPVESVLYLLPPSVVGAISQLTFDPPPRAVRRAMAMWSVLPSSGSSR